MSIADTPPTRHRKIVVVTGPSGAGRSTAIRVLEDLGYEAIDNMPIKLLRLLLEDDREKAPLALSIDPRNRDFSVAAIWDFINLAERLEGHRPELLFLDCSPEVLIKRFSETRRRHPTAQDGSVNTGIENEAKMLSALRENSDILIDTSELNVHQLREEIEKWFSSAKGHLLNISSISFSYRRGLPRAADLVFDCRFLANPHWDPSLRALTGLDPDVQNYVSADPRAPDFEKKLKELFELLLPAYMAEGKSYISVAFGCTGGKHRSVTMAERFAAHFREQGWDISVRHRDLKHNKIEGAPR